MNAESGAPTPDQAPANAPDLRPALSRAFDQGEAVIACVTPDQLTQPTPCTEWDVRALLSHLVLVARRIAVIGQGRSALEVQRETIPDGQVRKEFHAARDKADSAWADDAALTREVEVPWGRMAGGVVLGGYLPEVVTHTWDLWIATGSSTALDAELAEVALAAAHRAIPAARDQFPFAAVVQVPENADAFARLAGWMGRPPDWRTAAGRE
jgi:uncharacterized protein (TIGR03086 family)